MNFRDMEMPDLRDLDQASICAIFGIPPSRPVGEIKNAIKDAILDGIIPNEPGPAMELMLRLGAERGLQPVSPSSRP
jgi:poly(A) polymerase